MHEDVESRLADLERPERLSDRLSASDFAMMVTLAFVLPVAALLIAWMW